MYQTLLTNLRQSESVKNSPKKASFKFFCAKTKKNVRKLMVCTPDEFFNALQEKSISKLKKIKQERTKYPWGDL